MRAGGIPAEVGAGGVRPRRRRGKDDEEKASPRIPEVGTSGRGTARSSDNETPPMGFASRGNDDIHPFSPDSEASGFPFPKTAPNATQNQSSSSTSNQPQNTTRTVAIREPSPVSRSVSFAPLSPTSTRALPASSKNPALRKHHTNPELSPISDNDSLASSPDYQNSPEHSHNHDHHHRRRRRRNSDPSSDRPHTPSKQRRRRHHDDEEEEVEVLPDRFDREGRYIGRDRSLSRSAAGLGGGEGSGSQQEMVEKLVEGFGDVVEGRASWKDLLKGVLMPELMGQGQGGGSDVSEGGERRRRKRRG